MIRKIPFFIAFLIWVSRASLPRNGMPRVLEGNNAEVKAADDGVNAEKDNNEDKKEEQGCHNELLYSYGVLNAGLTDQDSRLCMDAKRSSCCSHTSEEIIMNYWKNNNKMKIKQYIEAYLWLFRSLINYYTQYVDKAKNINEFPSSPTVCRKAATYLIDNFLTKNQIELFVDKLSKMYEHVASIRKGFYCLLCSSSTQKFFDPYDMTVTFAKKFCENLVQSMIVEIFERNELYMSIFNAMSVVAECDPNEGYSPEIYSIDMSLGVGDQNKVQKCHDIYFVKNQRDPRVFFEDCQEFCSAYSLTRATEIFEGNFGKLYYLYLKIQARKEFPAKEQLIYDFINPKSDVFDFGSVSDEFFDANLKSFDLERYTPVWDRNGIEMFYLASQSRTNFGDSSLSSDIRRALLYVLLLTSFLLF
jgi:hypothetical protein